MRRQRVGGGGEGEGGMRLSYPEYICITWRRAVIVLLYACLGLDCWNPFFSAFFVSCTQVGMAVAGGSLPIRASDGGRLNSAPLPPATADAVAKLKVGENKGSSFLPLLSAVRLPPALVYYIATLMLALSQLPLSLPSHHHNHHQQQTPHPPSPPTSPRRVSCKPKLMRH